MKSYDTISESKEQGYLRIVVTFTKATEKNPRSFDGEGKEETKNQRGTT